MAPKKATNFFQAMAKWSGAAPAGDAPEASQGSQPDPREPEPDSPDRLGFRVLKKPGGKVEEVPRKLKIMKRPAVLKRPASNMANDDDESEAEDSSCFAISDEYVYT
eukprot:4510036-Alexandrium_andersonii.AAC.1